MMIKLILILLLCLSFYETTSFDLFFYSLKRKSSTTSQTQLTNHNSLEYSNAVSFFESRMQRLKSQTQLQKESLSQKTLTTTLKNSYTQLRLLTGPIFSDRSTSNIITQNSKIFPFFGENNIERTKILLQTSSPSTKIKTSSISQTTLQMNIISALI